MTKSTQILHHKYKESLKTFTLHMHTHFHSSTIQGNQGVEAAQMSIDESMDK